MNNEKKKSYKIVKINGLKIYYKLNNRRKFGPKVSVVFLSGYKSDMQGNKAIFLEELSKKIGFEYLRFDYSGHGLSEGKIEKQTLSSWVLQSEFLIKKKLSFPTIIVGSSLGGWISIILSKKLNNKIRGIVGIGAAPDFTRNLLMSLTEKEKKKYYHEKVICKKSNYTNENYIFSKEFIEDSKKYFILNKLVNTNAIVSLLYGSNDSSVKLDSQLKLIEIINGKDVKLTIIKNGDHRLSTDKNLEILKDNLCNIIKDIL